VVKIVYRKCKKLLISINFIIKITSGASTGTERRAMQHSLVEGLMSGMTSVIISKK